MINLFSILTNKYFGIGLIGLTILLSFIGTITYYKSKLSILENSLVKVKNESNEIKDKLNYEIYKLSNYKKEAEVLIKKQNEEIDNLNKQVMSQKSIIAKYVVKYDNIAKEKQKIIEQYNLLNKTNLTEINASANKLLEEVLWKN